MNEADCEAGSKAMRVTACGKSAGERTCARRNHDLFRKGADRLSTFLLWTSMAFVSTVLCAILFYLASKGRGALSWEFVTAPPRNGMTEGGIVTPIVGTLQLILVSMCFAFPVGVVTAVYFNEYASAGALKKTLRLTMRSLASIPSVVLGLFGLAFFCTFLRFGASLLSAGLTLGCMVLPTIVTASETALANVPRDYRDASYALGATEWQTIYKVILPSAFPGIITGGILSVGRVAGETAPIMFTGAVFFAPGFARSVFDSVMALPYHVYVLATAGTNIEKTTPLQYGTILVLIAVVLGISTVGMAARSRLRKDVL
ncbi:MAG: phosphate ABC transporter permease PstA [Synergistaceae bacterium]|jgi:phosphate transport system permease protein|nr:phosphate ABC transporter permease PstA [Synergistaceae bacterium]